MNLVVVESPAKAKTINKYLGRGYEVLASFGHVRDLPAKNGSVDPDADFRMIWEVDAKAQKRLNDIARAAKGADKLILATDPDREGEAISWHVLEVLKQKKALNGQADRTGRVQRHHQASGDRGDDASAPHRPGFGRCLSGAPGARLSGRLHPFAGAVAQASGRALGRPGAIGRAAARLRPRAGNREIRPQGILVADRDTGDAAQRDVRSAPRRRRRQEAAAPRHRLGRRGRSVQAGARNRRLHRRRGRGKAGQAASATALHHLDPAAGSKPQARLCPGAYHARGAAALRRHRYRRRDHRPHYLYAHRRRADRRRGDQRRAQRDRDRLRRAIRAARAAPLRNQGEERAGSARGHPSDRSRPPAERDQKLSRCGSGQALRADLAAHGREPDGIGRARAHDGRYHARRSRAGSSNCAPPARW